MATKKASPKPRAVKASKKPATLKKSGLKSIFNFSTAKGKFLSFIAIFAVLGGGYMTYQTFAATSTNGSSQPTDVSYYCASPRPTISQAKGSTGGCVKYAQWVLILASQSVGLSGTFDSNTTTAVKNIQKAQGLTVDGIIGPKTWEKLDSSVRIGNTSTKRSGLMSACLDARIYSGTTVVTNPKVGPTYTLKIIAKNTGTVTWPQPKFAVYPYLNGSNDAGISGISWVSPYSEHRTTKSGEFYADVAGIKFSKAGAYYFQNQLLEDDNDDDSRYYFGPRCDLRIVVG